MAIGNPLLAVWDVDGVLRTYEYVGGSFVSLASVGGLVHTPESGALAAGADPAPYLKWDWDDNYLMVIRANTTSSMVVQTYTPVLGVVQAPANLITGINSGALYDFVEPYHQYNLLYSAYARLTTVLLGSDGIPTTAENYDGSGSASYMGATDFVMTKDGENAIASYEVTKPFPYRKWFRYTAPTAPKYFPATPPAFNTIFAVLMATSYNGKTIVTISAAGACKVWHYESIDDVGNATFLHDLVIPSGTPQKIAMSKDNVFMAISALSGGVYTTFVYKRFGEYFQYVQTLTGIGKLLEFSYDGVLLIDSGLAKCYRLDGSTFTAHHTAMTSIPTLVQAQALSKGRTAPNGYSYLYAAAVDWLSRDDINLADLKFDLLTDSASFNEDHTAISVVTNSGAYRTTTGGWPVGGKPLANVVRTPGDGTLSIDADTLSHIAIDTNLSARYGVIYEVGTGRPLIWIDLNQTRTVARGREIIISFRGGELLKFSK